MWWAVIWVCPYSTNSHGQVWCLAVTGSGIRMVMVLIVGFKCCPQTTYTHIKSIILYIDTSCLGYFIYLCCELTCECVQHTSVTASSQELSQLCRMSACRFCCPNGDILCRVGDMSRHVAGHVADTRKCRVGRVSKTTRHLTTCRGDSRHVGSFVIVVWAQTQKLYENYPYVWADLYLLVVIDINWVCRGLFCVATTRNVGQDLATFGDVGDMSATRRQHSWLRPGGGGLYSSCQLRLDCLPPICSWG